MRKEYRVVLPKDLGGVGHVRLHLLILVLRRQRQVEPYEFKGRLVYIRILRQCYIDSKKQNKNRTGEEASILEQSMGVGGVTRTQEKKVAGSC